MIEEIYQTVSYEVVSLNDPELDKAIVKWTDSTDFLDELPADTLSHMQDLGAYLVYNESNGALAAISPEALTLNFQEYHPSEGLKGIRKTVIEKVLDKAKKLDDLEESDDFYRGVSAIFELLMAEQTNGVDV